MASEFELLQDRDIAELKTRARLYRHLRTGAEVLSLSNNDENKVFGAIFRSPPKNSTGVAHILEHSVLCGSRKYPVKEPFVELLKGSLKTFLNAFTYPDKTCYPVASQNLKDFYNLVDVYLDAVFYPRITPFVFQQEGWHLELESVDRPLTYKGVVFNEMKGAYSSPDNVLSEFSQHSIFPDITYGLDSGGDPGQIPSLTFEEFRAFHTRYYHPSNARFYFYGDDDPERRLEIVHEYIKDFDRQAVDSAVHLQPVFSSPRRFVRPFAAGDASEDPAASPKGMITVNWLLSETTDPERNLALQVLQYILIGMPGSPLRKALIDSGLGEGLAGNGLENELRQMYFSTGLKGIDTANADRVESIILDTLASLADGGIDPQTVEAAVNTIEFRLRENNTGSYPRGLVLMLRALTTWLYDADPMSLLAFEGPLSAFKSSLAADPSLFQAMIRRLFLDNPHRTTVVLEPDPHLAEKTEEEEKARLAEIRKGMNEEELRKVVENTLQLRHLQETPDSPEALRTIPTLSLSDLGRRNKAIPLAVTDMDSMRALFHDIFTNGITYLDVGFDLHTLPQRLLPYVPLFGRALVEMGTHEEDFVSLSQRISRKTGGIRPEFFTSSMAGSARGAEWLFLRGKSMSGRTGDFLAILRDVLLWMQLDNRDRFRQLVYEEKARQEQKLVPNGHLTVNQRLRAQFCEADWVAEQMSGVSYLQFVRRLAADVDSNWSGVLADMEEVRRTLVNRESMLLNVTLDEASWSRLEPHAAEFIRALPCFPRSAPEWRPELPQAFEGLSIPSQVNFVGKGGNLYDLGYVYHGSAQVISGYLRNSWLWDKIRVQGGAYGAFCLFDRLSGIMTFVSYRDPNLKKTLDNFDGTSKFLRSAELSDDEIAKAVIGTIGSIDAYLLPDARGYVSLLRYLSGDTDEVRQSMRDQVLATTASDFRAFSQVLERFADEGIVKVLGSQGTIDDAVKDSPGWLNTLKVL